MVVVATGKVWFGTLLFLASAVSVYAQGTCQSSWAQPNPPDPPNMCHWGQGGVGGSNFGKATISETADGSDDIACCECKDTEHPDIIYTKSNDGTYTTCGGTCYHD